MKPDPPSQYNVLFTRVLSSVTITKQHGLQSRIRSPSHHDDADDLRRFYPPSPTTKPKDRYDDAIDRCSISALRYIRNDNCREMLIYVDGACSNNGTPQARAGYGVKWSSQRNFSYRFEVTGPETSNRAELRAAIFALGPRA